MWAGILTFLFGALLIVGSPQPSFWSGRGPPPPVRWSIELFVMGTLVMGAGVYQMVLSARRRKRKLAEVRNAEGVVAAFREPPVSSSAPRRPWQQRVTVVVLALFGLALAGWIALAAIAYRYVGV